LPAQPAPRLGELALAVFVEVMIGDPHSRWHPVAVFGNLVEQLLRTAPTHGRLRQVAWGTVLVAGSIGGVGLGSAALLERLRHRQPLLATILAGALLKTSCSYLQLEREVMNIAALLDTGQVEEARLSLRALVSRPADDLAIEQIASAAIESLAENLSDSLVAPLLAYVALGVPGAMAYRASNTLDAMVGYHGSYEYLGKSAARLDDLLNLMAARLTAGLLCAALLDSPPDLLRAVRTLRQDHARTESPNAGWPMAAMAGALGVELEKVDHYRLGTPGDSCTSAHVRRAVRLARRVALLSVAFSALGIWAREPSRTGHCR
jgi:adenosylcobinamide-phosphate synthase